MLCICFPRRVVTVPCNTSDWKADVDAMAAAVNENTALIVGSACSYPHGVVDPIRALGALALANGCLLHVDGCIGGFVLPYFNRIRAGDDAREFDDPVGQAEFDFRVPGVTSISVDLHKYAFCPKGASVIVYRDKALRNYQLYAYAAWAGYTIVNNTFQSSKTAGPVAAAWAVMNYIGDEGYYRQMLKTYRGTRLMADGIRAMKDDLELMAEPESCLIVFTARDPKRVNCFFLAELMKRRGPSS